MVTVSDVGASPELVDVEEANALPHLSLSATALKSVTAVRDRERDRLTLPTLKATDVILQVGYMLLCLGLDNT